MLSQVTRLLALVSAPPLETATVRHVEVLLLQPQVVMVVVITSTGGVTKRVYAFAEPVDPGSSNWARAVPERPGRRPRAREQPAAAPARRPGARPRASVPSSRVLRPLFDEALAAEEQSLYVGGTAGLLDDLRGEELESYQRLLEVLEKRAALLDVLAEALDPRRPFVRVGAGARPSRRSASLSLVGASYGLDDTARSARSACSARCAWTTTRRSARCARPRTSSPASSRRSTTTTRAASYARERWRRPSATTTSCSASRATADEARDQEGVPRGSPASCTRTSPRSRTRRSASARSSRRTRCSRSPRRASSTTATGTRACAAAASRRRRFDLGSLADLFSRVLRRRPLRRRRPARAARAARTSPPQVEIELAEAATRRRSARCRSRSPSRARRAAAAARSPAPSRSPCPTCDGRGRLQQVSRTAFGEFVRSQTCPALRRRRPRRRAPVPRVRRLRAHGRGADARRRRPARDPRRPADPHLGRGPRRRARRPRRRRLRPGPRQAATRASCARATTSSARST